MVPHPGEAARAGGLLPLNLPQPIAVDADAAEQPVAVRVRGKLRTVVAISDRWRIDDEWWRSEISRVYYAVELEGGIGLTVFRDLVTGAWFQQQYTPPARMQAG
ncbi:MAG: hypothetical protein LC118_08725 [Dehalococcoidia bacterium]|nr:hypothetical protein [Dehalococcoidia bacterium]